MIRKSLLKIALLLLLLPLGAKSQPKHKNIDSLSKALEVATTDSAKYFIYAAFITNYVETNRDSALFYNDKCMALSLRNGNLIILTQWNLNNKSSSFSLFRFHFQFTSMSFRHYIITHTQAQARSLPGWFGGKERLKYFV